MDTNADQTAKKKAELAQMFSKACGCFGDPIEEARASNFIDHFASITPPQYSTSLSFMKMDPGGEGGAESVKPGNIVLNISRLVTAVASGVLTAVGVVEIPWTAVFGALVVWNTLYSAARVKISERDASVMWTLWLRRDEELTVPDAGLLKAVNAERKKHGQRPLRSTELRDALNKLKRIRSIERSSKDDSRWWLREWVRVTYK